MLRVLEKFAACSENSGEEVPRMRCRDVRRERVDGSRSGSAGATAQVARLAAVGWPLFDAFVLGGCRVGGVQ